jgi:hypothetical protein
MLHGVLTAATLPEAEIAPTVRLDCRRAFLNILTKSMCQGKNEKSIAHAIDGGEILVVMITR